MTAGDSSDSNCTFLMWWFRSLVVLGGGKKIDCYFVVFRALSWCTISLSVSYLACWGQEATGLGWQGSWVHFLMSNVSYFLLAPASRRVLMQGQECFTFLVRFKISNTLVPKVDCSVGFFTSLFSSRRKKQIVWGQGNFSKYSFLLPNLFFRLKSQTA